MMLVMCAEKVERLCSMLLLVADVDEQLFEDEHRAAVRDGQHAGRTAAISGEQAQRS